MTGNEQSAAASDRAETPRGALHILKPLLRWIWIAALSIIVASAARKFLLGALETRIVWVTFYPAVVIAALTGGLMCGLLASVLSCLVVVFAWPLFVDKPFIQVGADYIGMGAYLFNCAMISAVAEASRRSKARAKKALKEAEAANRSKSVFLANMSHELRTPLNAILGFSNLMRNDDTIPEAHYETLDIINRSGEHLLKLINNVLDMARIEAGRVDVEETVFDAGGMMRDITGMMRARAEEKGLELRLEMPVDFPRLVCADEGKLRQAVINLAGNAVNYTERGSVTLRAGMGQPNLSQRPRLIIDVEDTGAGLSAGDRIRIFEPFVQIGKNDSNKGTGLGLTITRQYVELMGGTVNVESAPRKGSVFRIDLPVELVDRPEAAPAEKKKRNIAGLAPGQPDRRIMIVEDNEANRLLLKRILEKAGFQVRAAENGAEGVELFQSWKPHFIWMDCRMPVMDGLEATRMIRTLEGGRDVVIVAITASVFEQEREIILAAGMDDFLQKPFRVAAIHDCLQRHLGIHYVYAETSRQSPPVKASIIDLEALAALPGGLRAGFVEALVCLDTPRIDEYVTRVAELDPKLGRAVGNHAGRLGYTAILKALQSVDKAKDLE